VLQSLGEYDKAMALAGKALEIFRQVLPAGHPYIERMINSYQSIKKAAGVGEG